MKTILKQQTEWKSLRKSKQQKDIMRCIEKSKIIPQAQVSSNVFDIYKECLEPLFDMVLKYNN